MLRIQTFGGLSVRLDDGRLPSAAAMQPRRLALLALLLRPADQGISRDKLIALLWRDADEEAGRRGLTQALYGLRTGLDAEQLVLGVQELRLNREVATSDVIELEEALAGGEYERAASLYKGPFLDGFRVPNAPEFDRWVDDTRAALAHRHAETLERLARRAVERGDSAAAAGWWRRRAGSDPLDSRVALELMRALAAGGDRAGALQHARVHTTLVEQELGLAPSPELLGFADGLRRTEGSTTAAFGRPPAATASAESLGPGAPPAARPSVSASPPAAEPRIAEADARPARVPAPRAARWLLAGGIIGAGVVIALAMQHERDESDDPVLRSLRLAAPQRVTNEDGLELDAALSPDGNHVAYAGGLERSLRIYVRQRAGSRPVVVSGSLGGEHRRPRWSPDGTRLAFQAERAIWVTPALGGSPRLVVDAPNDPSAAAHSPAWSPDGTQMAWVVQDTVFVRPLDGARARSIGTVSLAHSLAWSPDGRWIAVVSGNPVFIYGTALDPLSKGTAIGNLGPSAVHLIPTRCDGGTGCAPVLVAPPTSLNTSPEWLDASRLVFVSNRGGARDLFGVRIDPSGKVLDQPTRLTAGLELHSVSAAADGRTLAYSVFRQSSNIWSLDISSRVPRRLADATRLTSGRQTVEGMDLSTDGQWLAFDANPAGQQDIYVVRASGGEPERVVATPQDDFHPSWSPDGKWLAFYTFRDGVRRGAISSARGGPIRLLRPDGPVREEHSPVWTRDGKGLVYYRLFTTDTVQLFAVRRESDSTWSDERPVTRRGGVAPTFSADGTRMAYFAAPGVVRAMGPALDEASSRLVYASPAAADSVHAFSGVISRDGLSFIFKGEDRNGPGFWRVPMEGGAPRLLVRLDDPYRTAPRPEIASDGKRLFFTLTENEADVWSVRLEER